MNGAAISCDPSRTDGRYRRRFRYRAFYGCREEQFGEDDTRDCPVQKNILPLDGGPNQTRDDDAPESRSVIAEFAMVSLPLNLPGF